MTEITVEQYRAYQKTGALPKYRNQPMVYEGVRFDSKAELQFEMRLRLLKAAGRVQWWLHQVPFLMPRNLETAKAKRYLLDFLVFQADAETFMPRLRFVDVKGFLTKESALKIQTTEATYGIKIEIVKREGIETWG